MSKLTPRTAGTGPSLVVMYFTSRRAQEPERSSPTQLRVEDLLEPERVNAARTDDRQARRHELPPLPRVDGPGRRRLQGLPHEDQRVAQSGEADVVSVRIDIGTVRMVLARINPATFGRMWTPLI